MQDESDPFGSVVNRQTGKIADHGEFWDRPSGTSDRDLLEEMRSNNRPEGIRCHPQVDI